MSDTMNDQEGDVCRIAIPVTMKWVRVFQILYIGKRTSTQCFKKLVTTAIAQDGFT